MAVLALDDGTLPRLREFGKAPGQPSGAQAGTDRLENSIGMTQRPAESAEDVLSFWFAEGRREQWFRGGPSFDVLVEEVLGLIYRRAASGNCDNWAESPTGALALVLLLDQVPRNLFRNDPRAFATDEQARRVAHVAIEAGFDRDLSQVERLFLYLPFEHSEDIEDQELCCSLVAELDEDAGWLDYARQHRDIIARFGRFPHRNAALGRLCTAEEEAFLKEPDSSF